MWAPGCLSADNPAGLLWVGKAAGPSLLRREAAELVLDKRVAGLLPASACLELWLLLLPEASVGSCCPVSLSLGGGVGDGSGLELCCLSLGSKSSSFVSCAVRGLSAVCKQRVGSSETPAPWPGPAASPTDPKCIVLMHCRNVCNVFKPRNRLNNRPAVQLPASMCLQHPTGCRSCSLCAGIGAAALGEGQGLAGHSQSLMQAPLSSFY